MATVCTRIYSRELQGMLADACLKGNSNTTDKTMQKSKHLHITGSYISTHTPPTCTKSTIETGYQCKG